MRSRHCDLVNTKKGTLELKDSDCHYCVLGVLAEVSGTGVWSRAEPGDSIQYFIDEDHALYPRESAQSELSNSLKKYYGFEYRNPRVYFKETEMELTRVNDSFDTSFDDMADLLEETYLKGELND